MTWVKLDDQFFAHPKIINLSKDAKLLQLAALTYCAGQLTDGLVTPGAVRMICAQVDVEAASIQELMAAGVWEADGTNYRIHDYLVYQPSGEQVRAERAATAKRVERWRSNHPKSNGVTNSVRNGVSTPAPSPSPSSYSPSGKDSSITRESAAQSNEGEPLARTRTPSQQSTQPEASKPKKPANRPADPKPRSANPLWDVLVEMFYQPATADERKLFGRVARELREVNATPDEVRARVRQHAKTQSHWDLTPRALVTHWSELGTEASKHGNGTTESARRAALERETALDDERARQGAEMVRELAKLQTGG